MEFHGGDLFTRVGFIVTNLEIDGPEVCFYNKPGTGEQRMKRASVVSRKYANKVGRFSGGSNRP